jgi:hypothetical protein
MKINYPISFVFKHIKLSAGRGCTNLKPAMGAARKAVFEQFVVLISSE